MATPQIVKEKRSVKLSDDEKTDIAARTAGISSPVAKGLKLGVSREVIERIENKGSVSERTYKHLFPDKEVL